MLNELKVIGEHGAAIEEGKALILGVLVYYPDKDELVAIGIDNIPIEEVRAILAKFHVGGYGGPA